MQVSFALVSYIVSRLRCRPLHRQGFNLSLLLRARNEFKGRLGSIVGRRISIAFLETVSRTVSQNGCAKPSKGFGHFPFVHGEGCATHDRRTVEITDPAVERHGHERHLVEAAHAACDKVPDRKGSEHFACGWKIFLDTHQYYRVVFAGIFSGSSDVEPD